MRVSYLIHWLGVTLPYSSGGIGAAILAAVELFPETEGVWIETAGLHGYKYGAKTPQGARVLCGHEKMGTHLELSGEALVALRPTPDAIQALLVALNRRSATFSRIDASIDAIDSELTVGELYRAVVGGNCETKTKRHRHIVSENDGETLYIGAPTSDAQLRIYNKAAERRAAGDHPDADEWVRIELQLRRHDAHTAGVLIAASPDMGTAIRTLILAFADFPSVLSWARVLRGRTFELLHSTRGRGNTRKWLLGACASALAKEIHADKFFKEEFERSVASALAALDKSGS